MICEMPKVGPNPDKTSEILEEISCVPDGPDGNANGTEDYFQFPGACLVTLAFSLAKFV